MQLLEFFSALPVSPFSSSLNSWMDFTDRTFELREIETLRGHTDVVWCVSWNPTTGVDGVPAMIASCGGEKETVIWEQNTTTGSFQFKKVLPDLETNGFIWCAWAASASVLATSSVEGCICVWKDFEETFTETEFSFLRLRNHLLVNASLCASGEFIATVVPESDIRIWKIPSEAERCVRLVSRLTDSTGCTRMIRWHPLKDILFSSTIDCNIKIHIHSKVC
ncbi:protein transport protein SEC13-like [Henckelia pumila]|uniref:protein transport protein SEC13-like n=1 Tax=Henckelia pumila TaxID=405737 RepID=UPI003C6E4B52